MLEIICGPMFSGKSTTLLAKAERFQRQRKSVLYVKPLIDDRYTADCIATHSGFRHEALSAKSICEIRERLLHHDVIIIDEAQFFPDIELVDVIAQDRVVILACLDGDYKREPFANIAALLPKCERVSKLSAVCACGDDAFFTYRNSANNEQILVGGAELYEPVCRSCYNLKQRGFTPMSDSMFSFSD